MLTELKALAPTSVRRMGANPHANGGLLLKSLRMSDFRDYAVDVVQPGHQRTVNTRPLDSY